MTKSRDLVRSGAAATAGSARATAGFNPLENAGPGDAAQAEMQHRVRNILAMVRSIFARTIATGETLEGVSDHFHGRLDTLARYQGELARRPRAPVDLETMIRDELSSFKFGDEPFIRITGPEVGIGGDAMVVMALAIHELATNSIKFGVLARASSAARLDVEWQVAAGMLTFEWCETGVAIIAPAPLHFGFGREYLEQALPYQLDAVTCFTLTPGIVRCEIAVALDQLG